jgi:hypothetical protein
VAPDGPYAWIYGNNGQSRLIHEDCRQTAEEQGFVVYGITEDTHVQIQESETPGYVTIRARGMPPKVMMDGETYHTETQCVERVYDVVYVSILSVPVGPGLRALCDMLHWRADRCARDINGEWNMSPGIVAQKRKLRREQIAKQRRTAWENPDNYP